MNKFTAIYFPGCVSPSAIVGNNEADLINWVKEGGPGGQGFMPQDCGAVVDNETGEIVYEQGEPEGAEDLGDEGYLFLEHEGVRVYLAEDGGPNDRFGVEGLYSVMPGTDKDSEDSFCAEDLPQYDEMLSASEKDILRAAIDAGDLTAEGVPAAQ
jgi:hypothetical protein